MCVCVHARARARARTCVYVKCKILGFPPGPGVIDSAYDVTAGDNLSKA